MAPLPNRMVLIGFENLGRMYIQIENLPSVCSLQLELCPMSIFISYLLDRTKENKYAQILAN